MTTNCPSAVAVPANVIVFVHAVPPPAVASGITSSCTLGAIRLNARIM